MFVAINKDGNRISSLEANKDDEYRCPVCGGKVVLKSGSIRFPHFAHEANECLDTWHYDMSEWHRNMQEYFDEEYREVVCTYKGQKHRADILKDGVVIEFQHSPLSVEEYEDRNKFYMSLGYKVIWIFDVSEQFESGDLSFEEGASNEFQMRWKHPKQMLECSPVISDNSKEFALFLWLGNDEECQIEKVIWSAQREPVGYSFNRLIVSKYSYELKKNMNVNELFFNRKDRLQERLNAVKPYLLKKCGIKGFPRDSYVCPRRNEFGLKIFGETGCLYCRYCGAIEKVYSKFNDHQYNIYCCFPKQVNELTDPELGLYESNAPMF